MPSQVAYVRCYKQVVKECSLFRLYIQTFKSINVIYRDDIYTIMLDRFGPISGSPHAQISCQQPHRTHRLARKTAAQSAPELCQTSTRRYNNFLTKSHPTN